MEGGMISCYASDAPELVFLAELIARYTNAHCHMDLRDMAEAERIAEVDRLKSWFEELTH
jgi:hypothetical protein